MPSVTSCAATTTTTVSPSVSLCSSAALEVDGTSVTELSESSSVSLVFAAPLVAEGKFCAAIAASPAVSIVLSRQLFLRSFAVIRIYTYFHIKQSFISSVNGWYDENFYIPVIPRVKIFN